MAFFQLFFFFWGGPFFVPFIIIKGGGGGGVGPSFRFPAEAKTKKTRPKKQGSKKKGPPKEKVPEHPPLPKILGSLVPFFGGPFFGPLFGVPLALFRPVFGCFLGDFFCALFHYITKTNVNLIFLPKCSILGDIL